MQRSFGELLRDHRHAAMLSQGELATAARVSSDTIAGLECGRHRRPYPRNMRALADALKLEGDQLGEFRRAAKVAPVPAGDTGLTNPGLPIARARANAGATGWPHASSKAIPRGHATEREEGLTGRTTMEQSENDGNWQRSARATLLHYLARCKPTPDDTLDLDRAFDSDPDAALAELT